MCYDTWAMMQQSHNKHIMVAVSCHSSLESSPDKVQFIHVKMVLIISLK